MQVTIKYGPGNQLTRTLDPGAVMGDIIHDENIRAVLGFGDNVEPRVDGEVVRSASHPLRSGDTISLVTKAHSKNA